MSALESSEPDFQLFTSLRFDPRLLECAANTTVGPAPSPFYMLSLHRDRMLEAAKHFGWSQAEARLSGSSGLENLLETLKASVDVNSTAPRRVRAVVDRNGEISVDSFEIPQRPLRNLFPTTLPPPGTAPPRVSPLTGGALSLGEDDSTVQQGPGYGDPSQDQPWSVMVDPVGTEPSHFTSYKTTSRDMYNDARTRVGIESMADPKEVLITSTKDENRGNLEFLSQHTSAAAAAANISPTQSRAVPGHASASREECSSTTNTDARGQNHLE
ncbi:hypothetical protein V500_04519 [Pseudogymnoascus sp. VKM F-4518 (FW-2643)]|nr:hypothetical protein V500_04519 [Pseudogymnoascus sp. VKM F-4518 (FW-2643)]